LLGGRTAGPHQSQSDFNKQYYDFIAEHCDLASVDLDEDFYALRRPQDPERHVFIGVSMDDLTVFARHTARLSAKKEIPDLARSMRPYRPVRQRRDA